MKTFIQNESGAVTVDWVVLTAGLVGLGLAVMTVVSSGVEQTATDVDEQLSTQIITTSFPPAGDSLGYIAFDQARYDSRYAAYSEYLDEHPGNVTSLYQDYHEAATTALYFLQTPAEGSVENRITRAQQYMDYAAAYAAVASDNGHHVDDAFTSNEFSAPAPTMEALHAELANLNAA